MIKLLVKNRLRGALSGMLTQGKKASKGKMILFGCIFLYVFAYVAFLSGFFANILGKAFISIGASWLYFAIFTLVSFTAVFLLSIFETKSELFDCKDNDLLLSMPISEKALVISRLIVVLVFNYLIEALLILPAVVIYAIISHDAVGVVGALLVSLFTPLLATALSSGVGYALAYLSKKIRKSTLISVILALGFIALYFWAYNALVTGLDSFLLGFDAESFASNLKVLKLIGDASLLKPVALIVLILVCISISYLAYYLISLRYLKLATSNIGLKKIKYEAKRVDTKTPLSALCRKELRKFFTSSIYMLNSGIGLVFLVALSVYATVKREMLIELGTMLFGSADCLAPVAALALVFLSSMNMMSASALSLEGKNLWIIKSIPVKESTLLLSKALPQIIICTPPVLISSVLMIIATGASPLYSLFIIAIPAVANVAYAFLGLIFNILAPKFVFDNEAQPVKQSLAVFLTMVTQMIIPILAGVIGYFPLKNGLPLLASLIGLLFFVILTVALGFILFIPCKQKYTKL